MIRIPMRLAAMATIALAWSGLLSSPASAKTFDGDWAWAVREALNLRFSGPRRDREIIAEVVGTVRCGVTYASSCPAVCQDGSCPWEDVEDVLKTFAAERGATIVPVSRDRPACSYNPNPSDRPRGWKLEISVNVGRFPTLPRGTFFDQIITVITTCESGQLVGGSAHYQFGIMLVDGKWQVVPGIVAVS